MTVVEKQKDRQKLLIPFKPFLYNLIGSSKVLWLSFDLRILIWRVIYCRLFTLNNSIFKSCLLWLCQHSSGLKCWWEVPPPPPTLNPVVIGGETDWNVNKKTFAGHCQILRKNVPHNSNYHYIKFTCSNVKVIKRRITKRLHTQTTSMKSCCLLLIVSFSLN